MLQEFSTTFRRFPRRRPLALSSQLAERKWRLSLSFCAFSSLFLGPSIPIGRRQPLLGVPALSGVFFFNFSPALSTCRPPPRLVAPPASPCPAPPPSSPPSSPPWSMGSLLWRSSSSLPLSLGSALNWGEMRPNLACPEV